MYPVDLSCLGASYKIILIPNSLIDESHREVSVQRQTARKCTPVICAMWAYVICCGLTKVLVAGLGGVVAAML